MKRSLFRRLAICLPLPFVVLSAQAQFQAGDDFKAPSRDVLKWGSSDPGSGDSSLIETSGALSFQAPSPSFSISSVSRVWQGRSPGNTNDWQATLDVKLGGVLLVESSWASIALQVSNPGNPDNHVTVSLQQLQTDVDSIRQIAVEAATSPSDGVQASDILSGTTAQLRLNYDANSRMLVAGYSVGGTPFKSLGSWNTTFWNMNASSVFQLSIDAAALATTVDLGQITGDNFSITEKSPRALTSLQGGDDFLDNARSVAKWGAMDSVLHLGQLAETNRSLTYFTLGESGSDHDLAASLWSPGAGDLSKSWTAQVDVAVPNLALMEGQSVRVGLGVINLADPGDRVMASLGLKQDSETVTRAFQTELQKDGVAYADLNVELPTSSLAAALRARWDATQKLLYLEYDADGSVGGYVWSKLAQYSLDSGDTSWGLDSASRFQVGVFGESANGLAVPISAKVQLDNFQILTDTPVVQTLKLSQPVRAGTQLKLTWDGGKGPYQVQTRPSVATGAWSDSGSPVTVKEANVSMGASLGFFRILDLGQ